MHATSQPFPHFFQFSDKHGECSHNENQTLRLLVRQEVHTSKSIGKDTHAHFDTGPGPFQPPLVTDAP